MTDPAMSNPTVGHPETPAAAPALASEGLAGPVVPMTPDDEVMIREIDEDRRHERYLVRAALVAAVVIAIALAVRLVWG